MNYEEGQRKGAIVLLRPSESGIAQCAYCAPLIYLAGRFFEAVGDLRWLSNSLPQRALCSPPRR